MAENYQLKWHSHGTYLHTTLATLQKSRSFTDVSLCTVEGKCISAHRFILSACSKYFDKVLQQSYVAPPMAPLIIVLPSEINYRTLAVLIQYMYCGEATVNSNHLNNVLKAGDILQIRGLYTENKDATSTSTTTTTTPVTATTVATTTAVTTSPSSITNKIVSGVLTQQNSMEPKILKSIKKDTSISKENVKEPSPDQVQQENRPKPRIEVIKSLGRMPILEDITSMKDAETMVECAKDFGNQSDDDLDNLPKEIQDGPETEIIVKEEPIEWQDTDNCDFETHMTIQPEVSYGSDDQDDTESHFYAPLTCDICGETFTSPSLWVRHAKTHENLTTYPLIKRIKTEEEETVTANGEVEFKSLRCELCQEMYSTPSEWVKHIQDTHTNEQLAMTNNYMSMLMANNDSEEAKKLQNTSRKRTLKNRLLCLMCNKTFPSHASIMIHIRTHTGEKPYLCKVCEKGFNVKSNLLRHMRTLHNSVINSDTISIEETNVSME